MLTLLLKILPTTVAIPLQEMPKEAEAAMVVVAEMQPLVHLDQPEVVASQTTEVVSPTLELLKVSLLIPNIIINTYQIFLDPSNKAGNGGFSGTGDARGGDAGSAKRALESEPVGPELLPSSIPSAPAVPSVPSASIPSAPAATSVLSVLSESAPPAPSAPPTPPVPFVNTVLPPKPQATSSPVGIIHNSPATGLVPEQMNNTSQTNSEEDEPSQSGSGNVSGSA